MKCFQMTYMGLVLVVFSFSCKSGHKANVESHLGRDNQINEYALGEFGEDYIVNYNTTSEFVLISKLHKRKPSDISPTIRFQILTVDSLENIYSDSVMKGKVAWIDDFIIEVNSERGIPGPDDQTKDAMSYKYHVINRKKYSGGFLKNKN